MIEKNRFLEKGFMEVSTDVYSVPLPKSPSIILEMEVDNIEENELGTFIVTKFDNKIVRTGYYKDVDDLLSEVNM